MEAAAFSTGVSIQYPGGRTAATYSSSHRYDPPQLPFRFPADSKVASGRSYRSDTEAYSVCQELAYHLACEKTRIAVQDLLRKNNDTSYSQVLRFFEKYCARDEVAAANGSTSKAPPIPTASPSGRRRDANAPVLFPEFHAFPTAAVIAGTDATSSDLWVEPLTHKLRRSFPLCVLVQRDVPTARRFVEWLAARMGKLCAAKTQEEQWLEELVENFNLLPLDQPPVSAECAGRRMTRHQEAKANATADIVVPQDGEIEEEENYFESSSSSESNDEEEFGRSRRGRKRRLPSVAYGRWTMSKLLTTIQHGIEKLISAASGDTSRDLISMLGELVHDRLQEALATVKKVHESEEIVTKQRIACYDEAVVWLQRTISTCQQTAVKLLNVAPVSDSNFNANVHIGCTEMALALMLQRVLHQYASFLEDCMLDHPVVMERRKSVQQVIFSHKNHYTLQTDNPESLVPAPAQTRPFLLLCVEQLEAFSQQVLGDFLEIWTHFVRQQREKHQALNVSCTLGFVIGVASATSPALRRLDLTVTNRLELQFFSLVDSRKCFDDVLEALVVKAQLPLGLSGEVLRAIARRHHRLPSVPRLLLALRFLLFTHFQRCPWSFLALAVNGLSCSDVLRMNAERLPHRISGWIKHQRRRLALKMQGRTAQTTSSLVSWLGVCSALGLADLKERVTLSKSLPDPLDAEDNWMTVLEAAVLNERRRQGRWRMGWECFRAACTWLDVHMNGSNGKDPDMQEEMAVTHLALALEGRLGEAPRFMEVLRRMQHCTRWAVLSGMIEGWRHSVRVFGLNEDGIEDLETTLSELAMLCAYARTEKTPAKMQIAMRDELVAVFTGRLIIALLHPSVPDTGSPADALVANWSVLMDANVLDERLRFEYHDNLRHVLLEAGMGEVIDANNDPDVKASWVHDVGLAFLFYQENASASLSIREWYDSFSSELKDESQSAATSKSKKRKAADVSDDAAIKARFVRAVCTLRHWGFIKNDAPRDLEQDIVEKLVFI